MKEYLGQSLSEWIHFLSGVAVIILSVWTIYLDKEVVWQENALYLTGVIFCLNRFLTLWKRKDKEYISFKHYMFFAVMSLILLILGLIGISFPIQ